MKCISWKTFETGEVVLFSEHSVDEGFWRRGDNE